MNFLKSCLKYRKKLMTLFFKNTIRIPLFLIFLSLNTIFHGSLVSLCGFIKFIIPIPEFRIFVARIAYWISGGFVLSDNILMKVFYDPEWDIKVQGNLNMKGTYLVISNHLSLLDIPALQRVFFKQIPFLRFFIKQQLIFVPFLGQGLWALNFPSMKRYSKETMNKHPELRGKDLETTKRSCENLRGKPVSMLIYAEGTRFTPEKHSRKNSPYKNLLKPRAGGIHTVLSCLGDELTSILNVTLVYPGHVSPSLLDFLLGKIPKVVIRIESHKLGESGVPSFETIQSKAGSLAVRHFLNQSWEVKDKIISKIHSESSITGTITQPTIEPSSTDSAVLSRTTSFLSE